MSAEKKPSLFPTSSFPESILKIDLDTRWWGMCAGICPFRGPRCLNNIPLENKISEFFRHGHFLTLSKLGSKVCFIF
jgi:hypothetical protein